MPFGKQQLPDWNRSETAGAGKAEVAAACCKKSAVKKTDERKTGIHKKVSPGIALCKTGKGTDA